MVTNNQASLNLSDFSHDALSKAFELIHTGSFLFENNKSLVDVGGILKCLGITLVSFFRDADDNWLFTKTEIAAELLFVVTF